MRAAIFLLAFLWCGSQPAFPEPDAPRDLRSYVESFFEPKKDLLAVKIAVDRLVNPAINSLAIQSTIAQMERDVRSLAGAGTSNMKLDALKRYLYESGAWNQGKPFQYDSSDPLGNSPENRLLERYLETRSGNCITMPILFAILGQRLGLDMTLSEAPLHVFVKYTDDAGAVWNLEATSGGGYTRDAWYRQKLLISEKSVALGTYLRPLTTEETTALIASFIVEDKLRRGEFEEAIAVSDVLLRYYPNFAYVLLKKGSAYAGLLERAQHSEASGDARVNAAIKDLWLSENVSAFAKAEALGWRPQDLE